MVFRIDIITKNEVFAKDLALQIRELGIDKKFTAIARKSFLIETDLSKNSVEKIACEILIDPVVETFSVAQGFFPQIPLENEILITFNAGVCDNTALSFDKALNDMNISFKATRTARYYRFDGLVKSDIAYFAPKILFNPLIEHLLDYEKVKNLSTLDEFAGKDYRFKLITVDILAADDEKLLEISRAGCLSLSLSEMREVAHYFRRLKRNPTDCELETIAAAWSEHCCHKTFRGVIDYEEKDETHTVVLKEKIDNLLKSTVMKATRDINHQDCVSVFHDNSGVVRFDEKNNICFKVETHNHPSSLEPYGGASTGIGGVIRDILGTGQCAKPFASIDVFCFAPWQISYDELPQGLLHPKRVINGVVSGVRDYGNRMGIPTVAGGVLFDERFLGNPLVYCGTLGILPQEKSGKTVRKGDMVMVCGAKTGRDGIHGATFSSKELDEDTVSLTSAVQIGNAIEEKKVTEAILRARDKNLFEAITDCGAGGLSSAITELAGEHGVEVNLDKVPLKYRGLNYTEIWISESQERMVFFADKANIPALQEIFDEEDVELTCVGQVTDTHKLILLYENAKVCELDMEFVFNPPRLAKKAVWIQNTEKHHHLREQDSYNEDILSLLSSPNIACKDWILRQYDHEVQGGSTAKSIGGIENLFVNNGALVRPDLKSKKCVAIGLGINPFYSDIDPYWMASVAIEEALRNVAAMGASIKKTFILDNFCWGSPMDEKVLGSLVRAAKGCYDFATYFGTPFISGKDSFYNEYTVGSKRIVIPGTLLISAMAVIDDSSKVVNAAFKKEGNLLYVLGMTKAELGQSEYSRMKKTASGVVPKVDKNISLKVFDKLYMLIQAGLVESCHDLSDGGLAVALAEMCLNSNMGANVFLADCPHEKGLSSAEILFSESASRFIIEVDKAKKDEFESKFTKVPYGLIGCVSADKDMFIYGANNKEVAKLNIKELSAAWTKPFKEFRYNP